MSKFSVGQAVEFQGITGKVDSVHPSEPGGVTHYGVAIKQLGRKLENHTIAETNLRDPAESMLDDH